MPKNTRYKSSDDGVNNLKHFKCYNDFCVYVSWPWKVSAGAFYQKARCLSCNPANCIEALFDICSNDVCLLPSLEHILIERLEFFLYISLYFLPCSCDVYFIYPMFCTCFECLCICDLFL